MKKMFKYKKFFFKFKKKIKIYFSPSYSSESFICSQRNEQQPTVSAASSVSFSLPALKASYNLFYIISIN